MFKKIAITVMLTFITSTSVIAADIVTFKSSDTTETGTPLMLTGKLTKPEGDSPFPAVVCLHGCGGISRRDNRWVERLSSWGYVTLQVDSFGPRGKSSICTYTQLISPVTRAQDAHDAKVFLAGFPFVNKDKIGVMGWSHGGWTTIHAISPKIAIRNKDNLFKAAIAFYPYCDLPLSKLDGPLLILIGDYDDWTPARLCSQMMPFKKASDEVTLKIYPKAYHAFDAEGMDRYEQGSRDRHRLLYNPAAASDSIIRVREFLEKHLKNK
jgi:dienelactone hydrolase